MFPSTVFIEERSVRAAEPQMMNNQKEEES